MDDIYLMTVFVTVCDGLSFAGAARTLDLSAAAVTRAIQALESRRGVELLVRHTRRVTLSEAGRRYLEDARTILRLIAEAEAAASDANRVTRGHLRVTAPALFGRLFVVPGITDYLRRYPEMTVSATFVDRTVNLIDEGFDVAIRIGQLPDSGMKALKVGEVGRTACASPDYLSRHGVPQHPTDLHGHRTIATDVAAPHMVWKFGSRQSPMPVKLRPACSVTGSDAAIAAAELGVGIVYLPTYQVKEKMASGALTPVLTAFAGDTVPIHLLHRESRFGSSRVRNFIELLAERLRADQKVRTV
ncbi:LysR family transcriptional regulator [Mitsuaria sp. 7]|uniref:LysR family transcriptional regulator n=1 Tax=Mitsuaria sp. 7 TaxID=1658665 RepID=UPI0007DD1E6D|nr:LysR family transcriptional regulator [Mitsuaria sp. 7]ANH67981.1 LysR family transcriptional regulator [Mitsuaria sp. 7]